MRYSTLVSLGCFGALIVGCDNRTDAVPTALKSGGGILASAVAATVSARGVGVAPGGSCNFLTGVCNNGGRGVMFHFSFTGTKTGTDPVAVTGTWTASDPLTGIQLQFTGDANLFVAAHALGNGVAACTITTPDGTTLPTNNCFFCAFDGAANGAVDQVAFAGGANNGSLQAQSNLPTTPCGGAVGLASGNLHID